MKRKSSSVQKFKDNLLKEKKILKNYLKLKQKISRYKKNISYTIAVSGGPDSMALLGLSNILMNEEKYKFFFVIVDHGIRRNSSAEAKKLKKILKKKGIKLEILKNEKKYQKIFKKMLGMGDTICFQNFAIRLNLNILLQLIIRMTKLKPL